MNDVFGYIGRIHQRAPMVENMKEGVLVGFKFSTLKIHDEREALV